MKMVVVRLLAAFTVAFCMAVHADAGAASRRGGDAHPVAVGLVDVCTQKTKPVYSSPFAAYAKAIYAAGNVPLMIPSTDDGEAISRSLDRIDVLLLCGGEDVETLRYDEVCTNACQPNLVRDSWEWRILDNAVRKRIPVVGICRGLQVLNVYFGGSLYQDLVTGYPNAIRHSDGDHPIMHTVKFEPGSRTRRLVGEDRMDLLSWHHQGVKRLAPGFKVAARSSDGFVEAIESSDYPAAGVQFHPELTYEATGDERVIAFFKRILEWSGAVGF